jgi:hypothetical protein
VRLAADILPTSKITRTPIHSPTRPHGKGTIRRRTILRMILSTSSRHILSPKDWAYTLRGIRGVAVRMGAGRIFMAEERCLGHNIC